MFNSIEGDKHNLVNLKSMVAKNWEVGENVESCADFVA
jgi:hypothetical protein